MEDEIKKIWLDVLNLETVGRHEDFFDLGGNSVLMRMVREQIKDELGVSIPMRTLLEHPTIAAMTQYAEKRKAT